jgi:glycosyltransferase involved in cell wall biosynthesis
MKILIIAFPDSIHTARWILQLVDQGWDIHLFPSNPTPPLHKAITGITYHNLYFLKNSNTQVTFNAVYPPGKREVLYKLQHNKIIPYAFFKLKPLRPDVALARVIKEVKPDIIHTLEIQAAGYLAMRAKKLYNIHFPAWIVTNWGSDIYLFAKLQEHQVKIKEIFADCEYYSCECVRDVALAKQYGYKGEVLPVFPNTGGFQKSEIAKYSSSGVTSARRLIMLKGYQHWAGRALVGLRALARCADLLKDFEIAIYVASEDVALAAKLFSHDTGIPTRLIPLGTPHEEILKLHGQARISIGLSISDAISTSLLEAMAMGSFPIQSWTSCANEWLVDGETGMLVPPEDPEVVEQAIRRALTDDNLVNAAAKKNLDTILERAEYSMLKKKAIAMYETVFKASTNLNEA